MPFYQLPPEWSETDHGFVYTKAEFFERIGKPVKHLEKELGVGTPFIKVLSGLSIMELDVLFNGAAN
jgi:hypothetical protein